MTPESIDIDDPIDEGFPVMVEAAARLCVRSESSNDICFKYHRSWAYLRRIGLRSITRRSRYFVASFRELARTGESSRVLISGSADYAMLANVLHAYRAEGVEPAVSVLDICETPLFINRWYAQRQGATISTIARNVLEFEADSDFDVVATDNFLSRIQPQNRSGLVSRWQHALRVGGKVVTTESVAREPTGVGARRLKDEMIEAMTERVLDFVRADPTVIDVTPETLVEYVRQYYDAQASYPLGSLDELTNLFESNGFRIEELSALPHRERLRPMPRRSDRMRLVASRRA